MGNVLKVLVVDDDEIVRMVHSQLLRREGYEVLQAINGAEAVSLLQEQSFDAVLMDINMPVMNGIEATERIRAYETHSKLHTPIIGLTGYASTARADCLAKGMNEVLDKPVSTGELLHALQQVVQST